MVLIGAPQWYFSPVGEQNLVPRNPIYFLGIDDVGLVYLKKLVCREHIQPMALSRQS